METQTIMTAEDSSAGRAAPFLCFISEEFFYPVLLNRGKILEETHSEIRLISRINMHKVLAGILFTFITEGYRVILERCTSFFQKSALLIPRTTALTSRHPNTLAFHIMAYRKISAADIAVHPTGRDKFLRKFFPHSSLHESSDLSMSSARDRERC